ncbi:hypothetical protein BDQ17DRAFT_1366206, partial [Cyathus striatus]
IAESTVKLTLFRELGMLRIYLNTMLLFSAVLRLVATGSEGLQRPKALIQLVVVTHELTLQRTRLYIPLPWILNGIVLYHDLPG